MRDEEEENNRQKSKKPIQNIATIKTPICSLFSICQLIQHTYRRNTNRISIRKEQRNNWKENVQSQSKSGKKRGRYIEDTEKIM